MKTTILINILQFLIGKNSAHIARKLTTWIGGFLLASVALPIDPGITVEGFEQLRPEEINDGLNVGELFRGLIGFALVGASRAMSFFRAKNLDWLSEWIGLLVGRSIHSLYRAGITIFSSFLLWAGFNGGTEEGLLSQPLSNIIAGLILFALSGVYSSLQDSKANPVVTDEKVSPPANRLW